MKYLFSYLFLLLNAFSLAQEENNYLVCTTHQTTFTGLKNINLPKNVPTPIYVNPNKFFLKTDKAVVSFAPNTSYKNTSPNFNTFYLSPQTEFYTPENFNGYIVYLQNKLFDRHNTIAQNFHTELNQNTETNQDTPNTYFIQSNGSSSQDFFHNKFYAVGIPAPSYHFSKNATAIDAAHLKIIAAKKQNFGYHAASKNFFLDTNYHNRPPPSFLS